MCPSTESLHRLADGCEVDPDVQLHVNTCAECASHMRSLQHLDQWLGQSAFKALMGEEAAAPSAEDILSAAMTQPPRRMVALPVVEEASYSERASQSEGLAGTKVPVSVIESRAVTRSAPANSLRRRAALAAAALMTLLAIGGVYWIALESDSRGNTTSFSVSSSLRAVSHARAMAPLTLLESLRASDPSLFAEASTFRAHILPRLEHDEDIRGNLSRAWARAKTLQDRLRVARAASELKISHLALRVQELLRGDPSPVEVRHGVLTLGRLGTSGGVRALRALRSQGIGAAIDYVDALVASGLPSVADLTWDLLAHCDIDEDVAFEYLNRVPGRASARILAEQWRAGARSPAVESFIAQRPAALDELKRAYGQLSAADRVSLLALLGSAGDRHAVPLLERHLKSGRSFGVAADALARVALAGSDDAMIALAEAIKASENPQASEEELPTRVVSALRTIGPAATQWGLRAAADSNARASLRRRALLIVGLTAKDPDAALREEIESYLSEDCFVRSALTALAHLGAKESVPAVARFAKSRNRSHRLTALSALCVIGGDESARVLASSLGHSSTRRSIMEWLRPVEQAWVLPVLMEGLKYRDSHHESLRRLRQQLGARSPEPSQQDSPQAWRRAWLGEATPETEEN